MGMVLGVWSDVQAADLCQAKQLGTVLLLALFWGWETWFPFLSRREGRLRHAAHNLGIALANTLILAVTFGAVTVAVAAWAGRNGLGLLPLLGLSGVTGTLVGLVLLDAWTYLWHRANHAVPLLWRFHRMHHSDNRMDVTTATRFHLGEHVGSSLLRLALIPVVGWEVHHLLLYDAVLVALTLFHHADISVGRWDRPLRWLIVTPFMHKVHHSRWRPETDSNYATVLSVWDRLGGTYRARPDPARIEFGLDGFDDPHWQTFGGMLRTPLVADRRDGPQEAAARREASEPVSVS